MSRRYLKRMAPSASSDGVTERAPGAHSQSTTINVKSRHLLPGDGITCCDEARKLGQRRSKPRGAGLFNAIKARMGVLAGAELVLELPFAATARAHSNAQGPPITPSDVTS